MIHQTDKRKLDCERKMDFADKQAAHDYIARQRGKFNRFHAYDCGLCESWHITTKGHKKGKRYGNRS